METVGDLPIHITHIQFNGFGQTDKNDFRSGAAGLAEYVNAHQNVTVDMGQIVFGPATTMTADGPWQYRLHQLTHDKWINVDLEMEGGSGIVPYTYTKRNPVNAVQWTIGLEFALLVNEGSLLPRWFRHSRVALHVADARECCACNAHRFHRTRRARRRHLLHQDAPRTKSGAVQEDVIFSWSNR